jgi:hypothetical protein
MDTLAHGLWGGVAFGRQSKPHYWMAFVLGMMPDLLSFGPFFIMWAFHGFAGRTPGEPPDPALIPAYVYQAYNVTHSLVIWSSMAVMMKLTLKRLPLILWAWPLHIVCDIPTHSTRFFPTPYLWPLPTPFVNGFSWGQKWFMALNYTAIVLAYFIYYRRSKHPRLSPV